ncbi:hypothetical protein GCM10009737_32550 [Nocardioides lentus]|uniref:Uncharacterized protein n=1 Tax=Nocardioides lentus TaxID=338077 RepID=A0ABP5B2A4_9ACTN
MSAMAVRVWCPDWCTVTEQTHLDDLRNNDGEVIHSSADFGHVDSEDYALSAIGSPDGVLRPEDPTHAPVMCMAGNGELIHPDDMERHARALLDMVARARGEQKERQR